MNRSKKHKIIINRKRLDVISADTAFYEFLADTRFYYSFDRLLLEEDRKKFMSYLEKDYREWFVIHIVELDGTPIPCYAKLQDISISENVEVILLDLDKLRESEWNLDRNRRIGEAVQELYGDDSFVYHPAVDEVELISGIGAHMSCQRMSLEQLQKNLEKVTEDSNAINEFVCGLRGGSRYLSIKVDGSIRNN